MGDLQAQTLAEIFMAASLRRRRIENAEIENLRLLVGPTKLDCKTNFQVIFKSLGDEEVGLVGEQKCIDYSRKEKLVWPVEKNCGIF